MPENPSVLTTTTLDISPNTPPLLTGHLNLGGRNPSGQTIELTSYYLLKDGAPVIPVMGEFHFSRYPRQYWEQELLKMKAGGIDIVATYIFWIHIEEEEGVFDWSGNNDLRHFVSLCAKHGLQAIARIGPFAHGECRNGGIPDWLYGRPFAVRSNDERYLQYVQRLYRAIFEQLTGLLYKDGGPIIGVQLENEYMHAGAPWEVTYRQGTAWVPGGSDGVAHMKILKTLAQQAGFDVPLYLCTGWLNSPVLEGELLPMQGGYAFTPWSPDPNYRQSPTLEFIFTNRHLNPVRNGAPTYDASRYPYVCCEIGGGIQDTYYHRNIIPPESVEALALMNLAGGANLIGYYMYHGGSQPVGKHSYMNEFTVPRISYDFQAPLREFGRVADSYRSLRTLHLFLKDFGALLAPMTVTLPDDVAAITPETTTLLRCAARSKDGAGFLFLNNYQDHVEMRDLTDIKLCIRTADQEISLPYTRPLTVAKNVTAILPFEFRMNGVRLRYATAQLLAKLARPNGVDYVFFAPHKMVSEYAFDPASYRTVSVTGGGITHAEGMTYVVATPGTGSIITLTTLAGETVRVLTLTRQQAEYATKQILRGEERLIISEGTLVPEGDDFYFYTREKQLEYLVYPPVEALSAESADGVFSRNAIDVQERPLSLEVDMIGTSKALLRFPSDVFQGVDSVHLQIDYVGDIGSAFIDGKLVHDNFYNGTVWEIGLNHFADKLPEKELLLVISPIEGSSGGIRYLPTGMAFNPDAAQPGVAQFNAITLVAEHKIKLDEGAMR